MEKQWIKSLVIKTSSRMLKAKVGWLKKSNVSDPARRKSSSFLGRSSNSWKKKFFLLLKRTEDDADIPYLEYHDKECTGEAENPRGVLRLHPSYRIEKKHDESGKTFMFEVKTSEEMYRLQAESETIMDLWVFYCQIQTKLRMDFPGHFFEVTPDDSDSMRRIGAKGSKCMLHISPWGLTIALKRSKTLLAQWPLTSIREFECSENGDFSIDAGRSAPMGQAKYIFKTAKGQDGQMYDLLDEFTTQLIAKQQKENPSRPPQPATEEEVAKEYESFRLATVGLLPGSTPRSGSFTSPPSASISVPGTPARPPPQRPRQQSIDLPPLPDGKRQLRHNVSEPVLQRDRPPLPPRNYPTYGPSDGLPKTYSSPYDHEDTVTLQGAVGGAVGGVSRASATESELMGSSRSGSIGSHIYGSTPHQSMSHEQSVFMHRHSNPPVSPYEDMRNSFTAPSAYENTARLSYPSSGNSGGISISPADMIWGGVANPAFIASPHQTLISPPQSSLSKSPWYQEIRYSHSLMPTNEILHTYLDPQLTREQHGATLYASPPTRDKLTLVIPPANAESSLQRTTSFDDMFGRMSMTSSGVGSPLIETLDLASSLTYASPRLSVGLPKTPSHTGLPPDINMYIRTPNHQMAMMQFPQFAAVPTELNPEYEKMAKQQVQSFNNNNQGAEAPSTGHYMHRNPHHAGLSAPLAMVGAGAIPTGHYMRPNPQQPGLSAPLAMVGTGAIPVVPSQPLFRMKRSHSEADLLDCKKIQEGNYMAMQGKSNMFAGYMHMDKGQLSKLKADARKKAQDNRENGSLYLQGSNVSQYQVPRSVVDPRSIVDPRQHMTEQEVEQSLQTFATTRRKKSKGFKMSRLFRSQKEDKSDNDAGSESGSPSQSPQKFKKSPSQALIGRMKKGKKDRKMTRCRSEPDLQDINSLDVDVGYLDMRKASFGSKMNRVNSDSNLLDDNVSNASGDSVQSEQADRIVYAYRKRFQSGDQQLPVPTQVPMGGYKASNGQAIRPASHSDPASAPTRRKFPLKMFRKSSKSRAEGDSSPNYSSAESSPSLSRSSSFRKSSPPKPSPKPKLPKLKIPMKSFSFDSGIVASESHKSFARGKSVDIHVPDNESKSTFYLSEDHETVTELTQRPLPTLPREMAPPNGSQVDIDYPRVKPPTPVRPLPVPPRRTTPTQDYQQINAKRLQRQDANQLPQDSQFIEEYTPTGERLRSSLSSTGRGSVFSGDGVIPAELASRPVPIPTEDEDDFVFVERDMPSHETLQQQSSSKSTSLV